MVEVGSSNLPVPTSFYRLVQVDENCRQFGKIARSDFEHPRFMRMARRAEGRSPE